MRDHLLDLVSHTFDLGCIDLVKITGTDKDAYDLTDEIVLYLKN